MSEGTSTINKKVWSMATVLMNDGVSNQDYLEQLTYLLFLKMIDEYNKPPFEKGIKLHDNCSWDELKSKKGAELFKYYNGILESLSEQDGMLREIYSGAITKISTPAMLSKIINMIDGETWTALSSDVKGDIYEGLLQKIAEDTKSGAGQYFTPRPIINAMVKCVRPEPNKTIVDPCCGSGGFLLLSKEYIENNYDLTEKDKNFLKYNTFRGWEIVQSTYRLCLMNLFMHNISDVDGKSPITRNDALLSDPGERFDYILTNPPFGKKSTLTITNDDGEQEDEDLVYNRQDFWTTSSNKQFNFVQHIHTLLKSNGKAAVVLPDNVLFEEGSGGLIIRKKLLETTNLHTILRLPTGIFYKQGVKANVLFFDNKTASKDVQTKEVWIYDLRTGSHFTLKKNPIKDEDLNDFIKCYNAENIYDRKETWSEENPNGRWRKFSYQQIKDRNYNLDIKWITEDNNIENIEIDDIFDMIQKESNRINKITECVEKVLKNNSASISEEIDDIKSMSDNKRDLASSVELMKKKLYYLAVNGKLYGNPDNWAEDTLGNILVYEQPTQYIVESTNYSDAYKTPVLTAGKSFILGYTKEETGIFNKLPVIIFDDFTTSSKYVDFPFKVKSSAMKILNCNPEMNIKFYYYLLQSLDYDASTHKRYWISEFAPMTVPVPPKEEQDKIVEKVEQLLNLIDQI